MESWLFWLVVGFLLVIAELLTGTLYLLVIGVGGLAAAAAAWAGAGVLVQELVGGAVAILGSRLVNLWHRRQPKLAEESNFLDRGQAVVMESWANESAGIARVKYRGTTWDARLLEAAARPAPGSTLYIAGQDGNVLLVAAAPQAR